MIDDNTTEEKVLVLFNDMEPLEEGVKDLTFVQDCHQTQF